MDPIRRSLGTLLREIQQTAAFHLHSPRTYARLQAGSSLALAAGLLLSLALVSGIFNTMEARLSDFLYRPIEPSGQVVLITADDASLEEIGPLPWSRNILAGALRAIAQGGPRIVVLDMVLAEPSQQDDNLAQAIASLPQVIQPIISVDATQFPALPNAFPRYEVALYPSPALRTHNTLLAHTTILPDDDGVVRRMPLAIVVSGKAFPALGVAALASDPSAAAEELKTGAVAAGDQHLPVDSHGQILLNFVSPSDREVISIADILDGRVSLSRLHNKIVLVGVTSTASPEAYKTPLTLSSGRTYPIELQADLIETLLQNRPLVVQDRLAEITLIFLVALLAGATLPHVRLLTAAGLTIVYFLLYLGYAFQNFGAGVIVEPLYPTLALFSTFASTQVYRYFDQDRERRLTERLFHRHAGPETIDQVLQEFDRDRLALKGTTRVVSVLYVDMREFATQSKSLLPEAAINLLNLYLSTLVSAIFRNGGLVMRQTGSVLVATWNIPIDQPDHARRATRTALEIRDEIVELNAKQPKELAVGIGMGIATGSVIAGRIGAARTAEFAIVGEILTIAEQLAMRRDGMIFLDAPTHTRISELEFDTHAVNRLRLRRKTDQLEVWEITLPTEPEPRADMEPDSVVE